MTPAGSQLHDTIEGMLPIAGRRSTLLDLVTEVSARSASEVRLLETVTELVRSGRVVLCGSFRGCRLDG